MHAGKKNQKYRYSIEHRDLERNWLNEAFLAMLFVMVTDHLFTCSLSSVNLMLSTSARLWRLNVHIQ